jgi:UDP-N-acetylglucosamine 2-epimerase (non-hydrolysing)
LLPVVTELTGRAVHVDLIISGTASADEIDRAKSLADRAYLSVRHEPITTSSSAASDLIAANGPVADLVGAELEKCGAQLLLLLGDRWELLPAATVGVLLQRPIAHIHGGEITEGALDERVRHAITKLADIHLCATQEAAKRIRQLGEAPDRIHVVGAPGLDNFAQIRPLDTAELTSLVGSSGRPLALVTYHPETAGPVDNRSIAEAIFRVAARRCGSVLVTAPGRDPGADEVLAAATTAAQQFDNMALRPNLGDLYPRLLATADVLIGNSSSGIIEAASFGLPVVDVGDRQRGRERARNVVSTNAAESDIDRAVEQALTAEFRSNLRGMVNPYGDGQAARRIADIVTALDETKLGRKPFQSVEGLPNARS